MEITINLKPEEVEEIISNHFALKGVNVQGIKFVSQRVYDRMDNDLGVEFSKAEVFAFMPALNG